MHRPFDWAGPFPDIRSRSGRGRYLAGGRLSARRFVSILAGGRLRLAKSACASIVLFVTMLVRGVR